MKTLILIAFVLLFGSSFAQINESNLVKDTVIIGNQAMVRVSKCNYTYVDSVTLPFKGASPSEVYRIAKTTKVLEVFKKIDLFRTTTIKYYDVYRYNTIDHKWEKDKDQKTVTSPSINDVFNFYFLLWSILIVLYVFFSRRTKSIFGKMFIAILIFVIIIGIFILFSHVFVFGWEFYIPSILILLVIFFIERKKIKKS